MDGGLLGGHGYTALDSLLPTCDWLMIACPLTPETRNLIDARRLARMKPTAGIANIARGEIIDEAALIDALKHQRLGHAYLDVFHSEPLAADSPLWDLPNVLISPHNAGASTGTYARGVEIFLRNLASYLQQQPLVNEAPPGKSAAAQYTKRRTHQHGLDRAAGAGIGCSRY